MIGGDRNEAAGFFSVVTGGQMNTANAQNSSISGGTLNATLGVSSSITAGSQNVASSSLSSGGGGGTNKPVVVYPVSVMGKITPLQDSGPASAVETVDLRMELMTGVAAVCSRIFNFYVAF